MHRFKIYGYILVMIIDSVNQGILVKTCMVKELKNLLLISCFGVLATVPLS